MQLLAKLWHDDRGFVLSTELILIATIIVIGLIVGLATFRDQVVQELGDTGAAVGELNQSYSVSITGGDGIAVAGDEVTVTRDFGDVTIEATFNNFDYVDGTEVCDGDDADDTPPAGIAFVDPNEEGADNVTP